MKLRVPSALLLSASLLILAGCGVNQPAPTAATNIYLDYNVPLSSGFRTEILDYPASGSSVTPSALTVATANETVFTAIAVDAMGRTYAGLYNIIDQTAQILVFAPGATGLSSPIRTFTSPQMVAFVYALTVDPLGNVYVLDDNTNLFKFGPTASGLTVPSLTLSGIEGNVGIATDLSGNLYLSVYQLVPPGTFPAVLAGNSIYVYNAGFTSSTPSRIINPPVPEYVDGLAVDDNGNIYASGELQTGAGTGRIDVYASNATGSATPTRTIAGTSTLLAGSATLGESYNTIAVDATGILYVRSIDASGSNVSILHQFSPIANGNVAPTVSLNTGLIDLNNVDIAVF